MDEEILNSAGNVFIDLGFSPEEAAVLQMLADLMAVSGNSLKPRN
jgi:hypothetical protein